MRRTGQPRVKRHGRIGVSANTSRPGSRAKSCAARPTPPNPSSPRASTTSAREGPRHRRAPPWAWAARGPARSARASRGAALAARSCDGLADIVAPRLIRSTALPEPPAWRTQTGGPRAPLSPQPTNSFRHRVYHGRSRPRKLRAIGQSARPDSRSRSKARRKASKKWPVLAGFGRIFRWSPLPIHRARRRRSLERKSLICQGLCRFNPIASNHPPAPRIGMCGHFSGCRTNRRVWDRPDLTTVLILWPGGGFVSKKSQLTWLGSFRPTRLPQTLDRPRPVLAGAPRPHRVAGRLARSARQKSRDGVTGGIGLGSAVVGSRDLVRIVARSRETGTLGSTLEFEPQISW